jgi:ATP-binding protein involved in chromosome partitioning
VHGAIIVTTPQEVAVGDALRGAKMFQRVGVPVLGIVENMSWFECPHCGKPTALFGTGGGERLAKELDLPLLGQIPLAPRVMEGGDNGAPVVLADARSAASQALAKVADAVASAMVKQGVSSGLP